MENKDLSEYLENRDPPSVEESFARSGKCCGGPEMGRNAKPRSRTGCAGRHLCFGGVERLLENAKKPQQRLRLFE
jgi:hypothetical protein